MTLFVSILNFYCDLKLNEIFSVRLVSVVGTRKAIELFQETQRIEKDGGMMIVNGKRRRTPGGVFFFLLKHDNEVTSAQRKMIFYEENKVAAKDRKSLQAMKRDQKVEELKKRLTEQDHLPLPNISSASSNENSVNCKCFLFKVYRFLF